MKVSLSTYGGLAGGIGQPPQVVDSDELDKRDWQELHRLVAAATAASASAKPAGSDQLRDAQTYEITIEDAGNSTVLEATDGSVPEEFAALRNWLCDHQRG